MPSILEVLHDNLTPEQVGAATDLSKEVLALACAGSGKSRTLAFRIALLVANGADPKGIVAFTFTEKAAQSIKRNVASALAACGLSPTILGAMYIGTIHGYCQHVLGAIDAQYRQYDVLDTNRLILYVMSRYPSLHTHRLRAERGTGYFKTIEEITNAWSVMNDEMADPLAVAAHDQTLADCLGALRDGLERDKFIDFSLMIRLVVEALEANNANAIDAVGELRHLMVDEYQDVNTAQERLIRSLHRYSESLFVVGDDDQSIYGWRGADVTNILTFQDRHPNASRHTLATNFRSTQAIVRTADAFAAAQLGANRIPKAPQADQLDEPRDYRVLWFESRPEEAEWVAERITALLGTKYVERDGTERGLTQGDFAILMRSTRQPEQNGLPRHAAFTEALRRRGLEVSLEAGGSPFEIPQVSALREAFELLRQNSPDRDAVRALFETRIQPNYPNADFTQLADVMARWGREIHTPRGGARRRVFPQNLVHELLESFRLAESEFSQHVLGAIGLFSKMIQDIETVYVSIDSDRRFSELLNFLGNIADAGYDLSSDDLVQTPDAVVVSTVHKVKGLEYPVVFVVDIESSRFPKKRSSYNGWLPPAIIQDALDRHCYTSNHDEEARLFYTALTRAERFLYVTGCSHLPEAKAAKRQSPYAISLADPEISNKQVGLPLGLARANPAPRLSESNLPTSYSEIRYFLRCPRDYQFRYRFGFTPAIVEMFGFGQTVHAAVSKLHEQFPNASPTAGEAEAVADSVFHLKHIPPSGDPVNRPGGYERAKDAAKTIARAYVETYGDDFLHRREVEQRFEIPVEQAVISGAIDLLVKEDDQGQIVEASVIDFKAMQGGDFPEENEKLDWTELALQVQLYAKAAREVLGEQARTGAVHLLKDNQRVEVPVSQQAVDAAVANVEWAVDRILASDFPMRPQQEKCNRCDFRRLCAKRAEAFASPGMPPEILLPGQRAQLARAFSEFDG